MAKEALVNLCLGFWILVMASFMGVFNSFELTEAFLKGPDVIPQWERTLFQSAHGHLGLFGLIHIAHGLTLAYSRMTKFVKWLQTVGLFLGCVAMGPLLVVRGKLGPEPSFNGLGLIIGLFLGCAVLGLISHTLGLLARLRYP